MSCKVLCFQERFCKVFIVIGLIPCFWLSVGLSGFIWVQSTQGRAFSPLGFGLHPYLALPQAGIERALGALVLMANVFVVEL